MATDWRISKCRALEDLCGAKRKLHEVMKVEEVWTVRSREEMWSRSTSFRGRVLQRKGEGRVSKKIKSRTLG
jgi:hypothetical protein